MCVSLLLHVQDLLNKDALQSNHDAQTYLRPIGFRIWIKGFAELLPLLPASPRAVLSLLGRGDMFFSHHSMRSIAAALELAAQGCS